MRLAELRKVIREDPAPNKEAILTVLYQDRGDEHAEWIGPGSGSFANEDENVNRTENPGPREKLIPTTRKPKPAVTAQAQDQETMQGFQLDPAQADRLRKILARQQQQQREQLQQVQAQAQGQDNNNPQSFRVPASSSFNFNFAAPPASSSPEHPPHGPSIFTYPTASSSSSSERPPPFNFAKSPPPQSEDAPSSPQ
ncbi:hypothetical protein BDR22DRAFT_873134 [Usnea florida]